MDAVDQLAALIDLAESVGITLRQCPPSDDSTGRTHPGGALVRLKGKEVLFLDFSAGPADQIAVVAAALAGRDEVDGRYLLPEIRQLIERAATDGPV